MHTAKIFVVQFKDDIERQIRLNIKTLYLGKEICESSWVAPITSGVLKGFYCNVLSNGFLFVMGNNKIPLSLNNR